MFRNSVMRLIVNVQTSILEEPDLYLYVMGYSSPHANSGLVL